MIASGILMNNGTNRVVVELKRPQVSNRHTFKCPSNTCLQGSQNMVSFEGRKRLRTYRGVNEQLVMSFILAGSLVSYMERVR